MNTPHKLRCQEMIIALFPSARPGIDFELTEKTDGQIEISEWNKITMGELVPMRQLREKFMEYLERKQRVIPTLDMSDPCPWLETVPDESAKVYDRKNSETHARKIFLVR